MRSILFIIAFIVLCGPVAAQEVALGRPGAAHVFVWKDREAQKRAVEYLRENGINQTTFKIVRDHMLSCMVDYGTPAKIVERVSASFRIEVIGGTFAGCRGIIGQEDASNG